MPSINIDDRELPQINDDTIAALKIKREEEPTNKITSDLSIDEIYGALRLTYTHEDLYQLDPEFVLHCLCRKFLVPRENVDPFFSEKIYGVLAIILNPLEITQDLSAFINVTLLSNDQPTIPGDGELVPSRYIPRMISAVNAVLPDDQDFHDVFWHDNIRKYIVECYRNEDNLILDDEVANLDDLYLSMDLPEHKAEIRMLLVDSVRKLGKDLIDLLPDRIWDNNVSVDEKLTLISTALHKNIPGELLEDTLLMNMLGKYLINRLYTKLYNQLKHI